MVSVDIDVDMGFVFDKFNDRGKVWLCCINNVGFCVGLN